MALVSTVTGTRACGVSDDLVQFGVQEGFPAGHEELLPAKGGELLHRGGGEDGGHAARVGLG